MIWKAIIILSITLCVLGDGHHAISEQRIKIIHKEHSKEHHGHHGELSHIGSKKPEHHEEYAWSYPSYEFSYKVHDPHTHDIKGQHESRHGDDVKGEYWLVEPDGRKRTVTYHADKHSGFHATVHYSDDHHHIHHHHEEHKNDDDNAEEGERAEEGEGGEEGGEAEGGEGGENEGAAVVEEVDEGRGGEESRGREEVGRWIHDRYWGHRNNDWHRDNRHHDHKHDHRGEERRRDDERRHDDDRRRDDIKHWGDERRRDEGHRFEEYKHKDISILSGLGSYASRDHRERAEWHGHDDRRDRHHEESRGRPELRGFDERDALPKHKSAAIVRENYYHPRYYRQSQHQLKTPKQ